MEGMDEAVSPLCYQRADSYPLNLEKMSSLSKPGFSRSKSYTSRDDLKREISAQINFPQRRGVDLVTLTGALRGVAGEKRNREDFPVLMAETSAEADLPPLQPPLKRSRSVPQWIPGHGDDAQTSAGGPTAKEPRPRSESKCESKDERFSDFGADVDPSSPVDGKYVAGDASPPSFFTTFTTPPLAESEGSERKNLESKLDSSSDPIQLQPQPTPPSSEGKDAVPRFQRTESEESWKGDTPKFEREESQGSNGLERVDSYASEGGMSAITGSEDSEDMFFGRDTAKQFLRTIRGSHISKRYVFQKLIGKGSYGQVFLAKDKITKGNVAVKRLKVVDNPIYGKRLLRELRILRLCTHENIITLQDVQQGGPTGSPLSELLLVFQYADTDMEKLIHSNRHFLKLHVQYFIYQILLALKYLHSCQVIHRDIKPANIFVNRNCDLFLGDFGLARGTHTAPSHKSSFKVPLRKRGFEGSELPPSSVEKGELEGQGIGPPPMIRRSYTQHVVTRWYRAPELMLLDGKYTCAIDLWSVGCILAELLGMLKESNIKPSERKPLFPGRTCFPLSAEDETTYTQHRDQLNVIFDVIGTPRKDQTSHIPSKDTRQYLLQLPKKKAKKLSRLLPGAGRSALDLLSKLLKFDPRERYSAEEALGHPYLEEVLDLDAVSEAKSPPILFDFESNDDLSMSQIRKKLEEEVAAWATRREHLPRSESNSSATVSGSSTSSSESKDQKKQR